MKKTKKIILWAAIILTVVFVATSITVLVKTIQFDVNCKRCIKRAAEASTVETAKEELAKAIEYAENNGLTEGNTDMFFNKSKNDIGYWYENLKQAYEEMEKLPEDATKLEESNLLMRIRKVLVYETEETVQVKYPDNISLYPNVMAFLLWVICSGVASLFVWLVMIGLY